MPKRSTSHPRTSKRQILLDHEIARDRRRKEIEADYLASEKQWSELGIKSPLHIDSLDEYTNRNLTAWENEQLRTPTGKYQDPAKVRSTYQQRFVELIQTRYPYVLDELRELTPLFQRFFGSNGERFELLFNRQNLSLFKLNESFTQCVRVYGMNTPLVIYKPDRPQMFQHDFFWNEYRPMLLLLRLKSVAGTSLATSVLSRTIDCLKEVSEIRPDKAPTRLHEEEVDAFLLDQIVATILSFFDKAKNQAFFSKAERCFADYLSPIFNGSGGEQSLDLEIFVEIQLRLLDWARKYNLNKDWLLRYAFDFVKQFSENPNFTAQALTVRTPATMTLSTPTFEFNFEDWIFSSETSESYERRLRTAFDLRIKEYFDLCHRRLNLEVQKRTTSPRDFDRLEWLAYATIEGLSKEGIQERIDASSSDGNASPSLSTLYRAFNQFKLLGLPVPE